MNNLICDKKKKPLKSYDFKGFNSICFPAGGERGICTIQNQLIKSILCKAYYLSDSSTDSSLLGYNYSKFKVVKYKYNYLNIKASRLKIELVI
jgi:hypothetical protein